MFKHEATAQLGDVIRSYDFRGMPEHIEGVVVDKGMIRHPVHGYEMYAGYTIQITKDTMGTGSRVGDTGYVPFETDFMEYDERVELVKERLTA